jgi:protein-tyrosine phosphatase
MTGMSDPDWSDNSAQDRWPRDDFRVLTICTANISRSPAAAALLRLHLGEHPVQATSAGLLPGGRSADLQTALAVSDHGADLSDHISRQVTPELLEVEGRDLVIVMARAQLRELVVADPDLWPRVVTLKELCRYLYIRNDNAGMSLERVLVGRKMSGLIGDDPADDLADVHGLELEHHREMVATVNRLTAQVAAWIRSLAVTE